jgi:hypothetical protein
LGDGVYHGQLASAVAGLDEQVEQGGDRVQVEPGDRAGDRIAQLGRRTWQVLEQDRHGAPLAEAAEGSHGLAPHGAIGVAEQGEQRRGRLPASGPAAPRRRPPGPWARDP